MCARDILVRVSVLLITITTSAIGALPSSSRATYAPTNAHLTALTYANGRWVAVGHGATRLFSDDGFSWTPVPNEVFDDGAFHSIADGNGIFIAVGEVGSVMMVSSNRLHSQSRMRHSRRAAGEKFFGIAFGNGRFVVAGTHALITGSGHDL